MSGKPSLGGRFDWKLADRDYVRVYEGLDLGCGTGLSTTVFARAVGPGGRTCNTFTGIFD